MIMNIKTLAAVSGTLIARSRLEWHCVRAAGARSYSR